MKNLTLITLFALSIASFIACGSDTSSQNSTETDATTLINPAELIAPAAEQVANEASSAQIKVEEMTKGMAEGINESVTAVSDKKEDISKKMKDVADKTSSKAAKTAIDKAAELKETARNVEQKQKPSVQDVEVNKPPRPSGKTVSTSNTAPPPPKPNSTKPPIITPPVKTSGSGSDKVLEKMDSKAKEIQANPIHKHSDWNGLLSRHVSSSGKVNYKGFKSDVAKLDNYLKTLADNPIENSWSKGEKMAYWINAYNAFTVKLIVNNYPVKSITDLENGKPWDKKWIKLGSKTYSLNNIENDILRPTYKDARIHFAVNCAAKSCPPLLNKAWTSRNLESNFEGQAKSFINNKAYNKVGASEIEISKIFEWYAVDFGDIVSYVNKYASTKATNKAKVKYMEYNWDLNE